MADISPWLAVAALGAFHGVNPAMGWLFAVALGLHRQDSRIPILALAPIALGHALSIAAVAAGVVLLGFAVDRRLLEVAAGILLIGWALYHAVYGHRQRVRVGMQTGLAGLGLWSFLMATGHGAGLMLVPVLIPLCLAATPAKELTAEGSLPTSLAVIGVHMAAMLAVTAACILVVHQWLGLGILRRGWINFDAIWVAALIATGVILIGPW